MRILIKDEYLDFEAPIQMTEEQRKKFIRFMKNLFDDVKVVNVIEKTKEMGDRQVKPKKWIPEELSLLLTPTSNKGLTTKLKRTEMSIKMMRGSFVPEFLVWAKKKGYSLPVKIETIKEFLDEREKE